MATHIYNNSFGYWAGGKSGFIRVEFKTNGNTYYGWIDCYLANKADSVILRGYAYNSIPNTLIHSGDSGLTTGVEQETTAFNHIGNIYPNAVNQNHASIEIDAKESTELRLEIMNAMGQVLQTEQRILVSGKNTVHFNVNNLTDGNYFVKLSEQNKYYFRKLIINR